MKVLGYEGAIQEGICLTGWYLDPAKIGLLLSVLYRANTLVLIWNVTHIWTQCVVKLININYVHD